MIDEILLCYGEFVNRDAELKRFCSILDEDEYIGMVVNGEAGIGKTWLQKRLIYECREVRKMRWAKTLYLATHIYNYMAVLRMLRDDIGPEYFQPFTDLLNYFTKPDYNLTFNVQNATDVKILEGAELADVKVNEITGQKIIIQDLNISSPREDKEIREQERMYKLTQQFLEDLTAALKGENVVILIDDVEEMPEETKQWLWDDFINGVLKRNLSNVRFVLCIDQKPELNNEFLRRKVRIGGLKSLTEEHIIEYLTKRNIGDEGSRKLLAGLIMANVQGNPKKMADMVTTFVEHQRNKEDD
jgi:hypothetical protein